MTDEMALRVAIEVLRKSVESGRSPSGLILDPSTAALREQAAEHLDGMLCAQPETALRALIDAMPIHVWTASADGSDVFFNRRRLEYTGPGVDWYAIVHPDERVDHDETWHTAVRTGQPFEFEQRLVAGDGSSRWFLGRAEPLRDQDGNVTKWVGINIDIEERKQAEQRQRRAEEDLRAIIDAIPVLAWRTRPDGSAEFLNKRFLDYIGFAPADALDWGWSAAVHPDDIASLLDKWQRILSDVQPGETEARLRRFDGIYRWFLFRANPVLDAAGNVECWYGTNIDIEDRKRAEQVQADAEQQLKTVIDTIPAHVWRTGPDGENDFINQARIAFGGENLAWQDFVHPEDAVVHKQYWAEARETGQPFEQEMRLLRRDGVYRWFLVRVAPQRNDDGIVTRWFGTNTDIDDLKRAQERIRRSEQDLSDAIDTIPTHVWSTLPDGSNLYVNRRRLDYTGERPAFEDVVHPDDFAEQFRIQKLAERTGEPWEVECRLQGADGIYRWFLMRGAPLRDSDGKIVKWWGVNTDVNDLRMAQQQLRLAERELRATIDTIPAHIWSCLPDGTSDYFNRRRVEYTGPDVAFYDIVHPDDRAEHDDKWATSIRTGQPFDIENRLRRFDGTYRRFLGRAEPLRDEQGNITRWFGTNTDIEDLRRTEDALQRSQAELAHVSRVSTLGELTASVTHEVNQPLAGIVTNAEASLRWLRRAQPNLDEAQQAIERIIRDGQRAADVVRRLRALVRKEEPVRLPLNLNELVEESLPLMAHDVSRQRIRVELSMAPHLPAVLADRVQLQQVLINLLINAVQAMAETPGPRVLSISSRMDEADTITISVRDSGPGIDPASARDLFKPFVTTKANGMGMGLSICRSIIEAHGGRIWADADATQGAVFRFTLPMQPNEA